MQTEPQTNEPYTTDTKIVEVISDPVFGDYGRLIFPVDRRYYSGDTLGTLRLTWYSNIDPEKTVEITNYMRSHALAGETVFYDIYTDGEKSADPAKKDTGLFFFKGNPGEKFAVCNAGGGFAYVGAIQDSFPHALELSKMGYNAFALIYRPGAQTACEDLARAISFIFEHSEENLKQILTAIPCGEARRVRGWRHGLALMALLLLAEMICHSPVQSSCNTQGTVIIQKTIRLPMHVLEQMMALQAGGQWKTA